MQGIKIILTTVFLFVSSFCFSQFEFGLKLGVQNYNIDRLEKLSFEAVGDLVEMSIDEVDFGFHAGIYGRIKILSFYVEPAILFNSHSASYNIVSDSLGVMVEEVHKEYYQNLDIPLMLGVKLGPVNVHAGPVAHIHLNSTSELFNISTYSQKFKDATFGYQAGIGADIKKLRLEINYEGNFSDFGDHMVFENENISFSSAPARIIFSVGISF